MDNARLPIYYTFGNHMHWVDMEWLWGYGALPGSVRDMLRYCAESGARGNINFDALGYEKLAAEAPVVLAELVAAVRSGQIEVAGGSYGQPYGLFHGGESNIRQRVYGARSIERLFGVRPRTFWEEEFDFFPQLPQILRGAGFSYASLFFQWTWHTPSLPEEEIPAIWWEGLDGSALLCAPRTALALHQWPEDVDALLRSQELCEVPARGIVQWLELLPSPDWMCRAELMLPPLRRLMSETSCEVRFATLPEFLEAARPYAVPRRYTLDDVYHGVSLGKNGDELRRASRAGEAALLAAEAAAAVAGLFGRPYPSWDVYPVWELEEGWRQLMTGQHHDNDECEALCGHIGRTFYARSKELAGHVARRTVQSLADRSAAPDGAPASANGQGVPRTLAFNPLGWPRRAACRDPLTGRAVLLEDLPPFGYRVLTEEDRSRPVPRAQVLYNARQLTLRRGALSVVVDRERGVIAQITSAEFPEGLLPADKPLADLQMVRHGEVEAFPVAQVNVAGTAERPEIAIERQGRDGARVQITVSLAQEVDAVDVTYHARHLPRPDGGVKAALQTVLAPALPGARLVHDHPYGVSEIEANGRYKRKYPTGDWMTSPQWYEEVQGPFTALNLLDFDAGERGLLYLHDGSQSFLRDGACVSQVLTLYDPWDEDYFVDNLDANVRLVPHGPLSHAERWRMAQEFIRPVMLAATETAAGQLPVEFDGVSCNTPGVALTALYRESELAGAGAADYAGAGMEFPYVLRLVELDGGPAVAHVQVPGPVAAAYQTDLLGTRLATLDTNEVPGRPGRYELAVELRAHEIATVYLDLVPGRKVLRGLDSSRPVWASAHRVEGEAG